MLLWDRRLEERERSSLQVADFSKMTFQLISEGCIGYWEADQNANEDLRNPVWNSDFQYQIFPFLYSTGTFLARTHDCPAKLCFSTSLAAEYSHVIKFWPRGYQHSMSCSQWMPRYICMCANYQRPLSINKLYVLSDNLEMENRKGCRSQTKLRMWCQPTLSDSRNTLASTRPIKMCS